MSKDNDNKGWIKMYRKSVDDPMYFSEKFTRWQAWCDLLLLAQHKQSIIYIRGNKVEINAGQLAISQERLAVRWQWSRTKVVGFLSELEAEKKIEQQKSFIITIISICKFNEYQNIRQQTEQQNGQQDEQQNEQQNRQQTIQQSGQQTEQQNGQLTRIYKNEENVENEKETTTSLGDGENLGKVATSPVGVGDQSDTFHAEYRAELAGQTENAIRAQRVLKLSAEEVVKLLDEYHDKQKLNGSVYTSRRDYRQHFIMWAEKRVASKQQKEQAASNGIRLGCEEWIDENGRRTYGTGKFTVPNDAPPRPSVKHVWVNSDRQWTIL